MKSFIVASVMLGLAALPAQARVPVPTLNINGGQFYMRCSNPPADRGSQIVGICAAYVAGIADGLADAGQVCMGPSMTAQRLLPISLGWIKSHFQNGGYPAALQIKTGLVAEFPCRSKVSPHQATPEELMEKATKFMAFMKAA